MVQYLSLYRIENLPSRIEQNFKLCKGMLTLSIAFCSVAVGRVVAELRGSVRALMVFARSMQFSNNIFAVNLHEEKK